MTFKTSIFRFFSPYYWEKRQETLAKKRAWRLSLRYLRLFGLKLKSSTYPDQKLSFNETQKNIKHEINKTSSDLSVRNDAPDVMRERICNSLDYPH